MCELCVTHAELIMNEVIPGYSLYQAKIAWNSFKVGTYCLVGFSSVAFIWDQLPIEEDLTYDMSGKELEKLSDDCHEFRTFHDMHSFLNKVRKQIVSDPTTGYRFYKACKKAGYSEKKHGANLVFWFFNHLAKKLKYKRGII